MIKTDLIGSALTKHSGMCEHNMQSIGLRPQDCDFLFTHALTQCDDKTLQIWS